MVVIVIPRILNELLCEVGEFESKILSLKFAERALRACSDELSSTHLDLALAYIATAREFIEARVDVSELAKSHHEYFSGRDGSDRTSEDIMWVAAIAVNAIAQREMEQAHIIHKNRFKPNVLDVAKEAQKIVGQCAAKRSNFSTEQSIEAARRARWAEVKEQLIELIGVIQYPYERETRDENPFI
ncbi:hypothetical protein [Nonomuraea polychroma]|uniref:hypothetical protein n=1 Tax=Nonomuraea polychroma TaxID=46176 RepID=UPI000FDD3552|nr:hypothetical protein [Nonomuraea polychroma]